jgi:hypothetical protein
VQVQHAKIDSTPGLRLVHLIGESRMSVRMIVLLGIFVWAPMMAYLSWKFLQTFSPRALAPTRRARRAVPAGEEYRINSAKRQRLARRY